MEVTILFPHQLHSNHAIVDTQRTVYLVEEFLFFSQYKFHKQKLTYHRASMKCFAEELGEKGISVQYINSSEALHDIRVLIPHLASSGIKSIHIIDPTDFWLSKRIKESANEHHINLVEYESPLFLNSKAELSNFFKPEKKSFFQTTFYKQQRKQRGILIETDGSPTGGKWTFDSENRKKYPKSKTPPFTHFPAPDKFWTEAKKYVETNFKDNPGIINDNVLFPYSRIEADKWLQQFFEYRFHEFGDYEDAIVSGELVLNHSVLTPMLNVGLIEPKKVVESALEFGKKHNVPINSLEGFIRQIIGWREFIRGMYVSKGSFSRTRNYWEFKRKIPASFYTGNTGILPIDNTIKKVLKTGYCHHIERLMILGNFMLLCEFDPDEVYRWFMELFVDAYDWVMVPNVYGMSQFADGGTFATKPYISSSNYVLKMSDYAKGEWQQVWDGLFWNFMDKHRTFFLKNPRLSMLIRTFDKMDKQKQMQQLEHANLYLNTLK